MSTAHISELRQQLMETLRDLRNRENPMEPDRARAVAQVATVLVDSAKVEVDYLKATRGESSPFLEPPTTVELKPTSTSPFPPGITGIRQHRIEG